MLELCQFRKVLIQLLLILRDFTHLLLQLFQVIFQRKRFFRQGSFWTLIIVDDRNIGFLKLFFQVTKFSFHLVAAAEFWNELALESRNISVQVPKLNKTEFAKLRNA